MSDPLSVRLHLRGVRVLGMLVDSVDRLVVEVESAREWSRLQVPPFCLASRTRTILVVPIRPVGCQVCSRPSSPFPKAQAAGCSPRTGKPFVE